MSETYLALRVTFNNEMKVYYYIKGTSIIRDAEIWCNMGGAGDFFYGAPEEGFDMVNIKNYHRFLFPE